MASISEAHSVMSGGTSVLLLLLLLQVCNHPDLFESRPIVSAYDMPGLSLQYPSCVMSGEGWGWWVCMSWVRNACLKWVGGVIAGRGRQARVRTVSAAPWLLSPGWCGVGVRPFSLPPRQTDHNLRTAWLGG